MINFYFLSGKNDFITIQGKMRSNYVEIEQIINL